MHAILESTDVMRIHENFDGKIAQWELGCTVELYAGPRRLLPPSSYHFILTVSDRSTFPPHCCDLQGKLMSYLRFQHILSSSQRYSIYRLKPETSPAPLCRKQMQLRTFVQTSDVSVFHLSLERLDVSYSTRCP